MSFSKPIETAYLQIALRPLLALAVDIAEQVGGVGIVKKQHSRDWLRQIYQANGFAQEMTRYAVNQDAWIDEVVKTKDLTQTWFQDLNAVSTSSIVGALKLQEA